ncbi:SPFH/Band 7/PHB domain protein [Auritidibacter sp. NML130574]|uniref:SPFH domain-containing protein n=1 Tax=Auritidibacter sp. NML130574 TaxID=2170745 RepID=UPI000D7345EC|nr:SPFH domain-containing protein [Auritidibacter sp. NML130574]AXR73554.1 SPFH/Band 7/PHB domain protein [Auritidibacter sp. NML130574]
MSAGEIILVVVMIILAIVIISVLASAIKIVPQARAGIVERLGKYQRTQGAGLTMLVPIIDRMLPLIDMREQVVSFPPQPVITEDNLVVSIDTVVYFQVTDPNRATYGIANYIHAVENLATTTLRNVVGGLNLEQALTSRDSINTQLRGVLDEATSKWGLRVSRVELKAIDPPPSIQDSMEKQMRAERDRRAAILTAEGEKQSEILTAEGNREASVLAAEGEAQARILRANAEAEAITTVFEAIHAGRPDQDLLAYQYLQTLPKLAEGDSNKMWIIPSELTDALKNIAGGFHVPGPSGDPVGPRNSTDQNGSQSTPQTGAGNNSSADGAETTWTPRTSEHDSAGTAESEQRRARRKPRPTTAAEVAEHAPKAPKLSHTSLEEALAEPDFTEDGLPARPPHPPQAGRADDQQ